MFVFACFSCQLICSNCAVTCSGDGFLVTCCTFHKTYRKTGHSQPGWHFLQLLGSSVCYQKQSQDWLQWCLLSSEILSFFISETVPLALLTTQLDLISSSCCTPAFQPKDCLVEILSSWWASCFLQCGRFFLSVFAGVSVKWTNRERTGYLTIQSLWDVQLSCPVQLVCFNVPWADLNFPKNFHCFVACFRIVFPVYSSDIVVLISSTPSSCHQSSILLICIFPSRRFCLFTWCLPYPSRVIHNGKQSIAIDSSTCAWGKPVFPCLHLKHRVYQSRQPVVKFRLW